jgi:hypothetical protein
MAPELVDDEVKVGALDPKATVAELEDTVSVGVPAVIVRVVVAVALA